MKANKVAFFGTMGSLALIMGFLENLFIPDIPFLPVGAKPGLSNIVTMYVATASGFPGALYIVLIKALFAVITRGVTAGVMSLCGGILSAAVTCILLKAGKKHFSFWGIGVMSAVMHNMGQLTVACVISGSLALLNYGKYLLIFSLITGSVTGFMLMTIMPRIPQWKNQNNYKTTIKSEKEMEK